MAGFNGLWDLLCNVCVFVCESWGCGVIALRAKGLTFGLDLE